MLAGATVWASCSSVGSVDHAALCRARCWTRPGRCAVGMGVMQFMPTRHNRAALALLMVTERNAARWPR